MRCARCGEEMHVELDEQQTKELAVAGRAVIQHAPGQCPREIAAFGAPTAGGTRFFEIRVSMVEVFPDTHSHDVLGEFTATGTASSAEAALQEGSALQRDYTVKIDRMISTIGFADTPVTQTPSASAGGGEVGIGFDTQPRQSSLIIPGR